MVKDDTDVHILETSLLQNLNTLGLGSQGQSWYTERVGNIAQEVYDQMANAGLRRGPGRPPKAHIALSRMGQEITSSIGTAKPEEVKKRNIHTSDFQKDLLSFKSDPVVRALKQARKKLFDAGEDDRGEITRMLRKRMDDLRERSQHVQMVS